MTELCPFSDVGFQAIKDRVNKISGKLLKLEARIMICNIYVQGVDDLINFWQISVNILLNELPFMMLAF